MTHPTASVAPGIEQSRDPVTEDMLRDAGIDLAIDFPGAKIGDFLQYPVLGEGGWFIVIKHQPTLRSVSRRPWRLLGPVSLLSDTLRLD
jgi:hypothetical protein